MNEEVPVIEILQPGPLTTVQDSGRPGYLSRGVPPAGAQDNLALRVANILVGNRPGPAMNSLADPGAAGLECTLGGLGFRPTADVLVAVTGGHASITCDGTEVPLYESFHAPAGSVVKIASVKAGLRCYVAIGGGIDVPAYLGSRATHVAMGSGGFKGRKLAAGDRLSLFPHGSRPTRSAPDALRFRPSETMIELRVTEGPEKAMFDDESIAAFFGSAWKLLPVSNRMGFRFSGPRLTFRPGRPAYLDRDGGANPSNIVDDLIPLGGIQCPDGTAAIVMGVEHPTAGGYTKIGTVITPDLCALGQVRPGQEVRFREIAAAEAREAAIEIENRLAEFAA